MAGNSFTFLTLHGRYATSPKTQNWEACQAAVDAGIPVQQCLDLGPYLG